MLSEDVGQCSIVPLCRVFSLELLSPTHWFLNSSGFLGSDAEFAHGITRVRGIKFLAHQRLQTHSVGKT